MIVSQESCSQMDDKFMGLRCRECSIGAHIFALVDTGSMMTRLHNSSLPERRIIAVRCDFLTRDKSISGYNHCLCHRHRQLPQQLAIPGPHRKECTVGICILCCKAVEDPLHVQDVVPKVKTRNWAPELPECCAIVCS